MKNVKFYKLIRDNEIFSFIVQYEMNDKFESKRYYYLSLEEADIFRIKQIDLFIEYCELNKIDIIEMSASKDELKVLKKLIQFILDEKIKKEDDNVNNNIENEFFGSLDKTFINYDYSINKNCYNDILENNHEEIKNLTKDSDDINKDYNSEGTKYI